MASTRSIRADALPKNKTTELDVYAAEFAKLVSKYPPTRNGPPSGWLSRLPNEAFLYFHRGTTTFGREARTPIERRGRLYLIHTALVFMWMSWGKSAARRRFQSEAQKGTRRAASLASLEHYRRGGVLAGYNAVDWFFQPVDQWNASLISAAVRTGRVPDTALRSSIQKNPIVRCSDLRAPSPIANASCSSNRGTTGGRPSRRRGSRNAQPQCGFRFAAAM